MPPTVSSIYILFMVLSSRYHPVNSFFLPEILKRLRPTTDVMLEYTIPHSVEGGMGGYAYAHEVASKFFPHFRVVHKGKVSKDHDGTINNAYHSKVDFTCQPLEILSALREDIKNISGKIMINFNFLALYKRWPDGNLGGVSEADCGRSDDIDFVRHPLSFINDLENDFGIDLFGMIDEISVTIHEYSRYKSLECKLSLFDRMMYDLLLKKANFKLIFVNLKDREEFIRHIDVNTCDHDLFRKISFMTVPATIPTDEKLRKPPASSGTLKLISFGHQEVSKELNSSLERIGLLVPYGLLTKHFDPDPLTSMVENEEAIALLRMDKAGDKYIGVRSNSGSVISLMSKGVPTCAVLSDAAPPWLTIFFSKAVLSLEDPEAMNEDPSFSQKATIESQIDDMMRSIRGGGSSYDKYTTACEQSYAAYMLYHSRVVTAQSIKLIYQLISPDEQIYLKDNVQRMHVILDKFQYKYPNINLQSVIIDMIVFRSYKDRDCLFERCREYIWQYSDSDAVDLKSLDDIESQTAMLCNAIDNTFATMDSDNTDISQCIRDFMCDLGRDDKDFLSSLTSVDLVYFRSTQVCTQIKKYTLESDGMKKPEVVTQSDKVSIGSTISIRK